MGPTIEEQRERIRIKQRLDKNPIPVLSSRKQDKVNELIDRSELYAERLRKDATPQELMMCEFLDNHSISYKFQHPFYVGDHFYILDFFLPFFNIAIEIDGRQHYTPEGKRYDTVRDNAVRNRRVKTIRIPNTLFTDFNRVYTILKNNGIFSNSPVVIKPKNNKRWKRRKIKFAKTRNKYIKSIKHRT